MTTIKLNATQQDHTVYFVLAPVVAFGAVTVTPVFN
jgi:hypothetical protein